ncbi:hypothetical protein HYY74_01545 [Candidatus Woesearchaeota archaeon]|nr:hypothetical protein [Candidatus Woesearchaeota archaeon]
MGDYLFFRLAHPVDAEGNDPFLGGLKVNNPAAYPIGGLIVREDCYHQAALNRVAGNPVAWVPAVIHGDSGRMVSYRLPRGIIMSPVPLTGYDSWDVNVLCVGQAENLFISSGSIEEFVARS